MLGLGTICQAALHVGVGEGVADVAGPVSGAGGAGAPCNRACAEPLSPAIDQTTEIPRHARAISLRACWWLCEESGPVERTSIFALLPRPARGVFQVNAEQIA